MHIFLFFLSGCIAGVVNAVAGGGSLLIYPLLLHAGIAPVIANATGSVIIWPGQAASAVGYRKYIKQLPKQYFIFIIPIFFGGLAGAVILQHTTDKAFEAIVPWFISAATALVLIQPKIHKWLYTRRSQRIEKAHRYTTFALIFALLFLVAIYGGYFGAGFGIMMLAFLGLTELKSLQQMNGLKNLMAVCVNAVAALYFINYHLVDWSSVPILLAGNLVGGWVGATYSAKLPSRIIRLVVIAIGVIVTVALFIKAYS